MIPPICAQNVDGASPDAVSSTSSKSRGKLSTTLLSTLLKSDLPLPDYKKRMKSLEMSFYGGVFVAVWVSKILCLNRQAFANILGSLLHL